MAAIALANPLSTRALTGNQFAPQREYSTSSSAALTEPREQAFTFASRASAYHVVVRSADVPSPLNALPAWVEPTIAAFIGIQGLPDNWNSYGSRTTSGDLIKQALSVLETVMQPNSPAPSVVPLGDGGLQIEWHRQRQDLEIVFPLDEAPQFYYRNCATGALDEGLVHETEKLIAFVKSIA